MSYRSSGPAPKRDDERVRRNEPTVKTTTIDLAKLNGEVQALEADPAWHSVAKLVFESLHESAQVVFWEPSDWAVAFMLCTNLSRELQPQFVGMKTETWTDDDGNTHAISTPHIAVVPMKGASLTAYLKGFTNLMMTEVDRLRAGVEIKRVSQLGLPDSDDLEDNVVDFKAAREASVRG